MGNEQVAVHVDKIVERVVEVPIEKIVTKEVPVYVDQGLSVHASSLPF
jgi:hypothetical protein